MTENASISINDIWINFVDQRFKDNQLVQSLLKEASIKKEPGENCLIINILAAAKTKRQRRTLMSLDWEMIEKEAEKYIGMEINF